MKFPNLSYDILASIKQLFRRLIIRICAIDNLNFVNIMKLQIVDILTSATLDANYLRRFHYGFRT